MTHKLLDTYAEYIHQRDALMLKKQSLIEAAMPAEVRARLEEIEAEFGDKAQAVNEKIGALEAEIKGAVKKAGETARGKYFMCVYNPGGKSAAAKDVLALADRWEKTNPEFASDARGIVNDKAASASIQVIK